MFSAHFLYSFPQVTFISHVISPVLCHYSYRTGVNSNISIDVVLSRYVTNGTKTEYHSGLSTYLKFVLRGRKYLEIEGQSFGEITFCFLSAVILQEASKHKTHL